MFASAFIVASLSLLAVKAQVGPSEPFPGSSYNQGADCRIIWTGDKSSTTNWKNMSIQLMTGNNFQMVHITTIATNQDGTVDGQFNYPCPEVTPNSAIYFYQFTAPGAVEQGAQWTTRFTIASETGTSTPPTEKVQPGTNAPIPWGTGRLVNPANAVPPPGSAAGGGNGNTNTTGAGPLPGVSTTSGSAVPTAGATTTTTTGAPVPTAGNTIATSNTRLTTSSSSTLPQTTSATNSSLNGTTNGNAALSAASMDLRMFTGVAAFVGAALAFSVTL